MAVNDITNLLYGDPSQDPTAAQPPAPASNPGVSAPVPASASVAATVVPSGIGSDARFPVSPPLGWNPPPLNPVDRDNLIKTVYGEASDQPPLGQAAIAHAILNRVNAGGYGDSITDVVHAPVPNPRDAARGFHEFSPWNPPGVPESNPAMQHLSPNDPNYVKIGRIVDQVYNGAIPDPTGGATHYYGAMPKGGPRQPWWAPPLAALNTTRIGGQTFVGGYAGPGQAPVQTALNP